MKIVIPGGSGQVGTLLARSFAGTRDEVVVLGRSPRPAPWRVVAWDAKSEGPWWGEVDGADVVINLTGRSVNCRYTPANRREILASRVDSTRAVGDAIARAERPPRAWLQASTATIYAHTFGPAHDESEAVGDHDPGAPSAWDFSLEVATAWERALEEAETPRTRKVALRSAIILSPDRGGIFGTLLGLVRRGLGGTAGSGRQYVSWIHATDFVAALRFLIEREDLAGPVNVAAPNPVTNVEFMRELRRAWGTRIGLPATEWMLALGALALRTETELVLKSRRVVPGRLTRAGFQFAFPTWREAAVDLVESARAAR